MRHYLFSALLSAEQCLQYYRGNVKYIVVTTDDGQRVQLQFRHVQPFVDSLGLRGRFRLTVSEQGAFVQLEKIN